jgi:hypothetical protein
LGRIRRAEFEEWTLFEFGGLKFPNYLQVQSVKQIGDRVALRQKFVPDSSQPIVAGKSFPEAAYVEQLTVYDCAKLTQANSEITIFNKSDEVLYHYKWADPELLNLSFGFALPPGSVGVTARNIACNEVLRTPLVSKKDLAEMRFTSLASTIDGTGDIYYRLSSTQNTDKIKEVISIIKFQKDRSLGDFLPKKVDIPDLPSFRFAASRTLFKCTEKKTVLAKTDDYDSQYKLVYTSGFLPSAELPWADIRDPSPSALMYQIVCGANEASK